MRNFKLFSAALLLLSGTSSMNAQNESSLRNGFVNPPMEARPRVWWHWMSGNISKDGIYKDLMWMNRAGIAGFHNFDAGLSTPKVVKNRIAYMTPVWKDAFQYALHLADSLGMEVAIASSPGWSETGGPWIKEEDGMKKLVWRQKDVQGGRTVKVVLPDGFNCTGDYQDYNLGMLYAPVHEKFKEMKFYKDIMVLAVKVPDNDVSLSELNPKITTSGGEATVEQLGNDSYSDYATIAPGKDGWAWVMMDFGKPQTMRSLSWSAAAEGRNPQQPEGVLQCSDNGTDFRDVVTLSNQETAGKVENFAPVTARYFRVRLKNTLQNHPTGNCLVSMLCLSPVNRIATGALKAAYGHDYREKMLPTPATNDAVDINNVLDVTAFVNNGVLTWKAPKGRWRIIRYGYSLTGKINHPASPAAVGLEVDKLDPVAVRGHYKQYLDMYVDASKGMMGKRGITHILNDSYEAGPQTWTERIAEEFKARRGYDLKPWMPALTGIIVKSSAETDRFLFDWRTTLGELMTEYHYDLPAEVLKEYGLKRYTESHEGWRVNMTDGMDCKRKSDIPMAAIWMRYKQKQISVPHHEMDIRESASVAHIYGQNLVAAESFSTSGVTDGAFVFSPSVLKPVADMAMANGLNRFVIHTSPHQPVDDKVPGLGLGNWGQWFDRHETWAEQAKAWTDYLSRSSYLLQQGKFVADVAFYYGEDTNVTSLYHFQTPKFPQGYNYDFVNLSVLRDMVTVENGKLVTKTGMKYSVLYLQNVENMSLRVLRRLAELADAGVVIAGDKPAKLASREGSEEEFDKLVNHIWNSGKRNVTTGVELSQVLKSINVQPDIVFLDGGNGLRYTHRRVDSGEIYWIANQTKATRSCAVSFNVEGKKPSLWHADTGKTEEVSYKMEGGRTVVTLNMSPYDAVFVMFVEDTDVREAQVKPMEESVLMEIATPWTVKFQEKRGAPEQTVLDKLMPLTDSDDPGIKYFSGTSTYINTFKLEKKLFNKKNMPKLITLDMGEVGNLAEVIVNGKNVGIVWKTPFTVDITEAVRPGENTMEIKVVNVWNNRMIGDMQPGMKEKITFYGKKFYTADDELIPSGLMGPVRLLKKN